MTNDKSDKKPEKEPEKPSLTPQDWRRLNSSVNRFLYGIDNPVFINIPGRERMVLDPDDRESKQWIDP